MRNGMLKEHKNYIQSTPYAKNAISMIYKVRILDRNALERKKGKEIYDLPLSIFKIRRGEKKFGFREMCSEHHLLVDL